MAKRARKEFELLYIFLAISTILLILAFINVSMKVLAILVILVFLLLLKPEDGLILFAYSSCFYKAFGYQSLYASIFLVYIVLLTTKAIIINYQKFKSSTKKFKIIFISTLVYLILQPIIFAIIYKHIYYAIIKLYIFLTSFILIYFLYDKINFKRFAQVFCFAILISCFTAIIGNWTGLIVYERLFMYDSVDVMRFSGIFMHPNSLARFCLLGLTLLFVLWQKDKKNLVNYFLMATIAIFGAMSYSKTYFIALFFILLFFFLYSFVHSSHKKQFLVSTFVVVLGLAVIAIICYPSLKVVLNRFFIYDETLSFNTITTGRIDIWKMFIRDQKSSVFYIIFGKTYMGNLPLRIGIHSTYLAIFYQYGIVGSIVLAIYVSNILIDCFKVRFRKIRILPICLVIITGLIGDQIFTHNGYLLWLFAFTALMDNKTNDYTREVKCENQG